MGSGSADVTCGSCKKAISKTKIFGGSYDAPRGLIGWAVDVLLFTIWFLCAGAVIHGALYLVFGFSVMSLGHVPLMGYAVPVYYAGAAAIGAAYGLGPLGWYPITFLWMGALIHGALYFVFGFSVMSLGHVPLMGYAVPVYYAGAAAIGAAFGLMYCIGRLSAAR